MADRAPIHPILQLQRTTGNRAVQRLLAARGGTPPAKLTVGAAHDPYEQEADRVSDQVMRMPEPQLQRACACGGSCVDCQKEQSGEEHKRLQMTRVAESDLGQAAAPPAVHEVLRSPGQPLDAAARAFMEPRLGYDFSQVRVHTDTKAAESARAVDALAYTVGRDVVFGAGKYSPGTSAGKRLLAHELAHVVQQRGGKASSSLQRFTAGEKHQMAPSFNDMLAQIKTLIDQATTSTLLGDELNLGYLVEIAGGKSAGRKLGEKLGSKQPTIKSQLFLRYLFTCRCGLIDMRHFFQLFYISITMRDLKAYRSRGPTRRQRRWGESTNSRPSTNRSSRQRIHPVMH